MKILSAILKPVLTFKLIFTIVLSSLLPTALWAAACCGGSSQAPGLILGDHKAQLGFSTGVIQTIALVNENGKGVKRSNDNVEQSIPFNLDASLRFFDFFQAGVSLPFQNRYRRIGNEQNSKFGISDVSLRVGYEIFPIYNYSLWQPDVWLFSSLTLPTGKSVYESNDSLTTDITGRGFFTPGVGAVLSKAWTYIDALAIFEVHHSLHREFDTNINSSTYVMPSWGGYALLGLGVSPNFNFLSESIANSFRFGLGLSPVYESALRFETKRNSQTQAAYEGKPQMVWSSFANISFTPQSPQDQWSFVATYSDQSLLGYTYNVAINRGLSLQVQKRFF